ncbi:MAG: hypothetical protein ACI4GX_09550 [Ruminococcus sp.]
MAEYIERDEILQRLIGIGGCDATDEWDKGYDGAIDAAISIVDCAPAADVQPVKHGRWITSEIAIDSGCTSCSCCHSEYYIGDLQALEGDNGFVMYCPNCGARMDGDE